MIQVCNIDEKPLNYASIQTHYRMAQKKSGVPEKKLEQRSGISDILDDEMKQKILEFTARLIAEKSEKGSLENQKSVSVETAENVVPIFKDLKVQ